jgi:hypothetical protein
MNDRLMILPAGTHTKIRLIRVPDDLEEHEAFRYVTGLIAEIEEHSEYDWDDILELLEDRGFEPVEFMLGPALD